MVRYSHGRKQPYTETFLLYSETRVFLALKDLHFSFPQPLGAFQDSVPNQGPTWQEMVYPSSLKM